MPGLKCLCGVMLSVHSLQAQLLVAIRAHVRRYYEGWMVCDECRSRTRMISVYGRRCLKSGCKGIMASEVCFNSFHAPYLVIFFRRIM